MKTLIGLTVANLKGLTRDRAALFWTFFFPIMFVLLFGVLFSGSSDSKVTVGWVDQDGTAASAGLRQAFANVPLLTLQNGTLADEKAAMQKGDISAIVVIPKGLQDAVVASKAGQKPSAADRPLHPTRPRRRRRRSSRCSHSDRERLQPAACRRFRGRDRQPADADLEQHLDGHLPRAEHPGMA